MNISRRELIRLGGLSLAFLPLLKINKTFAGENIKKDISKNADIHIPEFGLASYSTRLFSLDQTIEMTKRLGMKKLVLKEIHLPLNSSAETIKSSVEKIKNAGLDFYGAGVIYMKSQKEVDNAFEYARQCGISEIVGVPEHDLLGYVENKVKEYNISVAIHNHGPNDKVYPQPKDIYEKIKSLDKRMGICLDIGHTMRSGIDPSDALTTYFDRIMDIHLKDETSANIDGQTVEAGRGVIDLPKFVKTIFQTKYSGHICFEHEKDPNDPLPGMAESVGYIKGIMAEYKTKK